jgi:hypothetical protein
MPSGEPSCPAADELRDSTADKAQGSPSPPAAGGEGRGEEGHFCSTFPSPRSFLAGRGRRFALAASPNSMAVPSCPARLRRFAGKAVPVGHGALTGRLAADSPTICSQRSAPKEPVQKVAADVRLSYRFCFRVILSLVTSATRSGVFKWAANRRRAVCPVADRIFAG